MRICWIWWFSQGAMQLLTPMLSIHTSQGRYLAKQQSFLLGLVIFQTDQQGPLTAQWQTILVVTESKMSHRQVSTQLQDSHLLGGFWRVFVPSNTDTNDTCQSSMTLLWCMIYMTTAIWLHDVTDWWHHGTFTCQWLVDDRSHSMLVTQFCHEKLISLDLVTVSVTGFCWWLDPLSTVGDYIEKSPTSHWLCCKATFYQSLLLLH